MKWILRITGAIVALILLCMVGLVFMGMRADSDRMQTSLVIHRPPADVWPWLYEGDKLTQWVSWLKEVKRDPGPLQVGRKSIWTMEDANNGGKPMTFTTQAEAVEPERRYAAQINAPGAFTGTAEYRLVSLGDSTRLDSDARYRFDNWMARLFAPLIMNEARKKAVMDFEHLKTLVEKAK